MVICEQDSFELKLTNLNPNHQLTITWKPESRIISGQGKEQKSKATLDSCGLYTFGIELENQYHCKAADSVNVHAILQNRLQNLRLIKIVTTPLLHLQI